MVSTQAAVTALYNYKCNGQCYGHAVTMWTNLHCHCMTTKTSQFVNLSFLVSTESYLYCSILFLLIKEEIDESGIKICYEFDLYYLVFCKHQWSWMIFLLCNRNFSVWLLYFFRASSACFHFIGNTSSCMYLIVSASRT